VSWIFLCEGRKCRVKCAPIRAESSRVKISLRAVHSFFFFLWYDFFHPEDNWDLDIPGANCGAVAWNEEIYKFSSFSKVVVEAQAKSELADEVPDPFVISDYHHIVYVRKCQSRWWPQTRRFLLSPPDLLTRNHTRFIYTTIHLQICLLQLLGRIARVSRPWSHILFGKALHRYRFGVMDCTA
jgi:hypothetical protein